MNAVRSFSSWPFALACVALVSCTPPPGVCTPFSEDVCACPSGLASVSYCNSAGTGYGPCLCDADGGPGTDGGPRDAGSTDAAVPDAGPPDDAGAFDAGAFDAGAFDAGALDAGPPPSDAGPPPPMCTGGLTPCSGACVDLDNHFSHCGRCGAPCSAGQLCTAGACGPATGFVRVPAGTFTMGAPPSESNRWIAMGATFTDETAHTVTLSRPFEIMEREVTQAEFTARLGTSPSRFSTCGGDCPVERVSFFDAVDYANVLSIAAGLAPCYERRARAVNVLSPSSVVYDCAGYRLPTEAEWEHAYRAGTSTAWYCGDLEACVPSIAWFRGNAFDRTHPGGEKTPNAFGLYDMAGNVWEWVWDSYRASLGMTAVVDPVVDGGSTLRVRRGGSWSLNGMVWDVRAARRAGIDPTLIINDTGFRIARTVR